MSSLVLMAFVAMLSFPFVVVGDDADSSVARAFIERVATRFSGDEAYATVQFLDGYWRHPGNTGFNAGITKLIELLEASGYVEETVGITPQRLRYRVESEPLEQPTWEPLAAQVRLVGEDLPLLEFARNRNMLAVNSASTAKHGIEAELVYAGRGSLAELKAANVRGKVVFAEAHPWELSRLATAEGALGVLAYWIPAFNRPNDNLEAIVHESIPYNPTQKTWAVLLSTRARKQLKSKLAAGPVQIFVDVSTALYESRSLTLIAEVRGAVKADERFVFSAHLQEPGANDNASGVATLAEIADVVAQLVRSGEYDPARSMTFVWGDEFRSVGRFLAQDRDRAERVLWGLSLDMVGQDTSRTGGSFLIEKMPDPSAIWTRGTDKHSEWGGETLRAEQLMPHYLNDLALEICREVGRRNAWVVNTNPYEGGSDHEPFLRAGRPGLLFWHFTDQFYHTDLDRPDKVSTATMENVASCALALAMLLTTAAENDALSILSILERATVERLKAEQTLSLRAVEAGANPASQRLIIETWTSWYLAAVGSLVDLEYDETFVRLRREISDVSGRIERLNTSLIQALDGT
jgi:aminopeptidase YwaD